MNHTTQTPHSFFSTANLRLAWERMIRSNGKDVKDFFVIDIFRLTDGSNTTMAHPVFVIGDFGDTRTPISVIPVHYFGFSL